MDTKAKVAVDLLERVGKQRAALQNSERSLIPAALRAGLSVERVAEITGATVEHVKAIERDVT